MDGARRIAPGDTDLIATRQADGWGESQLRQPVRLRNGVYIGARIFWFCCPRPSPPNLPNHHNHKSPATPNRRPPHRRARNRAVQIFVPAKNIVTRLPTGFPQIWVETEKGRLRGNETQLPRTIGGK
jgi:hypothetical protein